MKYNIAVIFPSRGLFYTDTFKELMAELKPYTFHIYWSHGNPLPACFNKPIEKAMKQSHTHVLIVEDDMVIKPGTLKGMLEANERIIACDYPLVAQPSGTVLYDKNDDAYFTGTGFMLIKMEVLRLMPKPIFTSSIAWGFKQEGKKVIFTAERVDPNKAYGMHDITFGVYHYIEGRPIKVYKTILAQRKLVTKGKNATNDGYDKIKIIDKYLKVFPPKTRDYKEDDENDLLTEMMFNGKKVFVCKSSVKRLSNMLSPVDTVIRVDSTNTVFDFERYMKVMPEFKILVKEKK